MIKKFAIIIESHNVAGQKIIPGAKKMPSSGTLISGAT